MAVWYGCSRVAGDTVIFEIPRGALQTEVSVGLLFVCGGYLEGARNKLCRNIVYGSEVPQGGLQYSKQDDPVVLLSLKGENGPPIKFKLRANFQQVYVSTILLMPERYVLIYRKEI